MKVLVLGMSCLKFANTQQMMIKVSMGLIFVNVKDSQAALQKTITWTKNSAKRKQEWERACLDNGLWLHKLKNPIKIKFVSKVIMFEKTLEFKATILLCYGKQKTLVCSNKSQRPKCGPLLKLSLHV